MLKLKFNTSLTRFIIIGELILVTYLLYTLTVSVYKSYQLDQVINEYEKENTRIADENRKKTEDYDYFTSDNYIEKIAKQNLGLIRPGEEVVVMPKMSNSENVPSNFTEDKDIKQMSNPEIWWYFFFDRGV